MKITFHGAARTVTGSQHLLEFNGRKVLLECGLYQGRRKEAFERNRNLPYNAADIDLLILSHAHIDHSGNIPNLVKSGFRGDILCTSATRDLCSAMLRDSGHIQEMDVEFVNRKRARQGLPPVEPIYTLNDAVDSLQYFGGVAYNRVRNPLPGLRLTFLDAGHMLGSAIVVLEIEEDGRRPLRLVFTGDLGRPNIPIIRDPTVVEEADVLIIESTYGDRTHETYPDAERELERIVRDTYNRGGVLIIPAFAVGRTQQIVYSLHKLMVNQDIPTLQIYIDSPLAINATSIFQLHPDAYDEEMRRFMDDPNHSDPFGFDSLHYTRSVAESKALNFLREPAIIISASGMCEAGRILHHLRNRISDPRNTILIVGWQAPNTLGRRLVERQKKVRIFGEEFEVRAKVEVINGFSAHADRDELLEWASHFRKPPERTFVVHGDEEPALSFAQALRDELGFGNVVVPEMHQSVEV